MMHQYDQNQRFVFIEATKLASAGEEFSHLVKLLDPEYALRLRIYVQQMPLDIARKTIYGRSVTHGVMGKKKK
jgi:hypothetical protein